MKKSLSILIITCMVFLGLSCKHTSGNSSDETTPNNLDYRKLMRDFVIGIADYSRKTNPDFIVIPQNGQTVAWNCNYDDEPDNPENTIATEYFAAINGTGREDTFYGSGDEDYTLSPKEDSQLFQTWCDFYKNQTGADGKKITVLSIDYCKPADFTKSYEKNNQKNYVSYAAPERNLTALVDTNIFNENSRDINYLSDAKNFLYILNYDKYEEKTLLLNAIKNTNYDAVIMDAFFNDGNLFSKEEINSLKTKKNGGKRLIISYMSIGEAEDYRWYFDSSWLKNPPEWLDKENPNWEGNRKVKYWNKKWQNIIYGNENSYTAKLLSSGFDGVYLDIIDAYEYYEE